MRRDLYGPFRHADPREDGIFGFGLTFDIVAVRRHACELFIGVRGSLRTPTIATGNTRRSVLAAIGSGIATTGAVTGQEGDEGDQIEIEIKNCYTVVIKSDHPDAAMYLAGVYFRETDQHAAPGWEGSATFDRPLTLNLRGEAWARRNDGVFTDVAVADIDFNTLASEQVPAEMGCEDDGPGGGRRP